MHRKGKDAAMEKWDAEMRASLSSKKADKDTLDPSKLSKQDRELVEAQLRVEGETRKRVQRAYDDALRSLSLLRSIIDTKAEEVADYVPDIVDLILNGVVRHRFPAEEAMEGFLVRQKHVRENYV